jgi:hypothetical protein
MRGLGFFSLLLITYFMYGFYINQYDLSILPRTLKSDNAAGYYDYKGAINIHSTRSIGSANTQFIAASAKLAGLDFIMMTDLNQFVPSSINERYLGNLLVMNGGKFSYLDSRLTYYSAKQDLPGANLGETQVRFADFLSQKQGSNKDSMLILDHPFKLGFSWAGELPEGLDGIEIVNLKSLSVQALNYSKLSTLWSFLIYPFNSRLALIRLFSEPTEELALLDKVTQTRRLSGFAGAEASARALPFANYLIKFPSYQRLFETASNHVLLKSELTGNFAADKQKIFQALKNGQFYIAFDIVGDPKGFNATIEDKNKSYLMGSQVKFNKSLSLSVKLPAIPKEFFEIVIYRNGTRIKAFNTHEVTTPIESPGIYRVQVRVSPLWPLPDARKWVTWIYTNPFYVQP